MAPRQPRPPVPGSERGGGEEGGGKVQVFREQPNSGGDHKRLAQQQDGMGYLGNRLSQNNNNSAKGHVGLAAATTAARRMAPSPKATSESGASIGSGGRDRGFEPEGSADITPPFSESNSNNSTPAYLRWAENLSNLLSDPDGVELYKNYLKTENVGELLDFWFACQGLKKQPSDQTEKIFQLIKVINRKFLRSKVVPIAEDTRKIIQEKIASKRDEDIGQDIFDTAQLEVEDRMTRTTYRNFLASEAYLNYVQIMQTGESDFSAKCSGTHSTASSVSGKCPVGDDSGHFSVPFEVERSKNSYNRPAVTSNTDTTSDSTSGVSESSSMTFSLAAPNTSCTSNLGLEETEVGSSSLLMASMSALPTLHENSELDLSDRPGPMSTSLLGLSSTALFATQRKRNLVKPESQAGIYLQAGRVPHPYHAYNSAYNPVSRQDSELQSLSSDAQTTDDNMSSFTESSSHYSSYRQITTKKHVRRQMRRMQEQTRQNREATVATHAQQTFIPRTARVPAEATNQLPPEEFAHLLIQKLEKVKREQELNEKLTRRLAEDGNGSIVSQDSNRSLAEILREKLTVPPDESDQSILDEHVSRIWTDKTPLRSPGDPSGRPRSPGSRGRSRAAAMAATPLGQLTAAHRTLPGRGHPRPPVMTRRLAGPAGSGGGQPPLAAAAQQPPLVYHQDLAYYDMGAAAVVRVGEGGNTSRVMEWMLDVERQNSNSGSHHGQQQQLPADLRSQSSKGAVKTSPRSGRSKPVSHRSQSQERMSTSWAGHMPNPLPYQYQLEEAKRRLGASQMPPPPHGLPGQQQQHRPPPHGAVAGPAHGGVPGHLPAPHGVPGHSPLHLQQQAPHGVPGHHLPQQQSTSMMHLQGPAAHHHPHHHGNLSLGGAGGGGYHSNSSTLRKQPTSGQPKQSGVAPSEFTVAVYTFSHEREPMPYRIKIPSKSVTLRAVKDLLPKKGTFRFYFKTEIDGEACYEEETEDSNLVPLWREQVQVQCRIVE